MEFIQMICCVTILSMSLLLLMHFNIKKTSALLNKSNKENSSNNAFTKSHMLILIAMICVVCFIAHYTDPLPKISSSITNNFDSPLRSLILILLGCIFSAKLYPLTLIFAFIFAGFFYNKIREMPKIRVYTITIVAIIVYILCSIDSNNELQFFTNAWLIAHNTHTDTFFCIMIQWCVSLLLLCSGPKFVKRVLSKVELANSSISKNLPEEQVSSKENNLEKTSKLKKLDQFK